MQSRINGKPGSEILKIISSTNMSTSESDDDDNRNSYYKEDVCSIPTEHIDEILLLVTGAE